MVANCSIVNQVRQNIAQGLNNPLATSYGSKPFSNNKGAYIGTNVVNFVPVPSSTYLAYRMMIPSSPQLAPIQGLNPQLNFIPFANTATIPLGVNNNPISFPGGLNFPLNFAPSQNKPLPKNTGRWSNPLNWFNWGKNTGNNLGFSPSQNNRALSGLYTTRQVNNLGLGEYRFELHIQSTLQHEGMYFTVIFSYVTFGKDLRVDTAYFQYDFSNVGTNYGLTSHLLAGNAYINPTIENFNSERVQIGGALIYQDTTHPDFNLGSAKFSSKTDTRLNHRVSSIKKDVIGTPPPKQHR